MITFKLGGSSISKIEGFSSKTILGSNMKQSTKILGGIGALFPLASLIPYFDFLLLPVCMGLLIFAVENYSKEVNRHDILSSFTKRLAISLIGTLIEGIADVGGVVTYLGDYKIAGTTIAIGLLAGYILLIAGSALIKNTLIEIALLTKNNQFSKAGLLIFWGSVLSIVLIGEIISLVGWMVLSMAFFTTPEKSNTARVSNP